MCTQQREDRIIRLLDDRPGLTQSEIAAELGVSTYTARHSLKRLALDRKIHVSGKRRATGKPGSKFGSEYSLGAPEVPIEDQPVERSHGEILLAAHQIGGPFGIIAAQVMG